MIKGLFDWFRIFFYQTDDCKLIFIRLMLFFIFIHRRILFCYSVFNRLMFAIQYFTLKCLLFNFPQANVCYSIFHSQIFVILFSPGLCLLFRLGL